MRLLWPQLSKLMQRTINVIYTCTVITKLKNDPKFLICLHGDTAYPF